MSSSPEMSEIPDPERKKICHCKPTCGKIIRGRTRRHHYELVPPESIRPSVSPPPSRTGSPCEDTLNDITDSLSPGSIHPSVSPSPFGISTSCEDEIHDSLAPHLDWQHSDPPGDDSTMCDVIAEDMSDHSDMDVDDDASDTTSSASFPSVSTAPANDELDPWRSFDELQDKDEPISREEMVRQLEEMLGPGDDWGSEDTLSTELDAEDEARLWDQRNAILTEQDRDNIRAFHLKLVSKMPRTAYNQMVYAFSHKMDLSSEWVMFHRMALLSGVEPRWFDCCPESCIAYTGAYSELTECPHCNGPRFSPTGKSRRMFCYLPIIPRLQGFFQNPKTIERLLYRANYEHIPGEISDVFDCEHYRSLCDKQVILDGKTLPHKYFSNKYDICLGVCMDSDLLFKRNRGGPSATPILVKNYNIKPELRTHLDPLDGGLMSAGVIPGPHPPKDVHSFLIPYDDECAELAVGVKTFNASTREFFLLHGYNLFEMGDIIATEKSLNIKGHNSFSPCRSCEIKGVRNVTGGEKLYYVPLTYPDGRSWDPEHLPLRSPERLEAVIQKFEQIEDSFNDPNAAAKAKEKLSKFHGIKGLPALRRVGSLHYPRSRPWDLMHLLFENVIPNLVKLWSGKFKGLDTGTEDYEIDEETWEQIWAETTAAVQNIPADFVRALGANPTYYTAEAWAFWFTYLTPILLKDRFQNSKYHVHLCGLSEIIKTCLRFTLTTAQVERLRKDIINWVHTYEEYNFYYQYSESRLRVCTLTIHGMLHIPDDILFCGPSWTTWTYFMERYCGILQAGLRSKRFPWSNLNNNVLHVAYLEQLNARYDLEDELSRSKNLGAKKGEYTCEAYPQAILIPPYKREYKPDESLRTAIALHFAELLGKCPKDILPLMPETIPSFGKLRVRSGDSIRSHSACGDGSTAERNMSYIRYEDQVRRRINEPWVAKILYGRLDRILDCTLPRSTRLGHLSGEKRLLAVITPCKNTQGKDAALESTTYRGLGDPIVLDLQAVVAVVGRVETRSKWYIVDRTGGVICPEFTMPDEEWEES
ncbi:hypothetical protein MSAN_02111100 [Mycena sanguinolenta]|uniref:Transposase family Tnp2 protein n=1 Tax=Mycena sanguinolenta TaxID=230812 RepID=A0A8H6XG30_9AGAR|nr:hypothetical protein MSAN_02111100 [Mycena sanguinolenta]